MPMPPHILVVDDEAVSRDILIRRLKDFSVEGVDSGQACLEAVQRRLPDVILLDVFMPQMDGIAVLRELRKTWSQDLLPVILVTAMIDAEEVVSGFDAGANDYVVKPVNLPILVARINTHLRIKHLAESSQRATELQQANAKLAAEITERRRVEQEFHLSEERFAKAFRASPDGLVLSRRDSGKMFDVNDSFVRMFGFTREELLGKSGLELGIIQHKEDRDRAMQQILTTGSLKDFEAPARRKNGEEFPVGVTAETLEIAGEPCLLMIVRDITERYRSRQAMQLAHEELENRVTERTADL
jgi:PAS domain S-box-containing protein